MASIPSESVRGAGDSAPVEVIATPSRLAAWRRRPVWRAASAVFAVAAIGLSTYYIASKLSASLRQVTDLHVRIAPGPLVLSVILVLLCVLSGGPIWYLVYRGVGGRARLGLCSRAHLLSNLGAYLPGYGWRLVGKGYVMQREGHSLSLVSAAVGLEFAGLALTRLVMAVTMVSPAFMVRLGVSGLVPFLGWVRFACWSLLLGAPWALAAGLRAGKGRLARWSLPAVRPRTLCAALVAMCAVWALYGLGLAAAFRALQPIAAGELLPILFSATASHLVSLVLFVVPAGISVREGVIIFVLEGTLSGLTVTVGSLLSRVVLIVAELIGVLVGLLTGRRASLWK